MTVLVTGGAGFIGSHLVRRLLEETEHAVVILDNFNDYYDPRMKRANAALFENEPRVSLVDDSVVSLAERGPLAYRSRRLFDTAELRLEALAVSKPDGTAYRLANTPDRGGSKWALTAPLSVDPERAKAVPVRV